MLQMRWKDEFISNIYAPPTETNDEGDEEEEGEDEEEEQELDEEALLMASMGLPLAFSSSSALKKQVGLFFW